jgi:signal transduction histidine kinase/DNA-binding response OmpR family regulator
MTISIRQGFLLIAATVIVLLGAIFYVLTKEADSQRAFAAAEARHYASYKLADELRQSSDDLTRMARTYVVTGDPIYEEYFRRILAIRNGEAPRPEGYGGVYWDFVTATREELGTGEEPVALQELMRRMEFTEEEFAKLRESQARSDALVALEGQAMAAVKGLYADDQGRYTLSGDPDMALARELLHGPEYHRAKAEIMVPIQEFTAMVESRTAKAVAVARSRAERLARIAELLMAVAVGLVLLGLLMLQLRVARPVRELAAAAERAETGDYTGRVEIRTKDEIGQLGRAFNQMSHAIESDIAARELTAAELAQAREVADQANHAKSAFLAKMSHELRTPMNAIIGYSEMLIEDAEDDDNEEAVADLGKIHSAGNHLLSLINDVLDLSKVESGKMDLFVETFDISSMIDEVVTTTEMLVRKNHNQLRVEIDSSLCEMRADVTKVRQALFNLISNAAKFTENGEIGLVVQPETSADLDGVRMAVSDSGIGIPPDKLDIVFEEFSQAEEGTSRHYGGTGLGLPITQRFCQMMGGDVTLESKVGEGSTFTIWLPLVVEAPTEDPLEEVAAVTPQPTEERTVLVVDDDPTALDLIGRTLQGAGMRVVTASDGEEALRLACSLHPAAITLDVMMPDMDGWEVLRKLKANETTREIPVVMVTMTDDRALGAALGATEFLTKPVQRGQLVQLLDRFAAGDGERRVLVVDDLAENREVLQRALEAEGWQVTGAENGRVALARVAERKPSLVLLDLMMPVMDGFEFVLEMRKRDASRSIPIVVVTAKDITDEDRRRLNGGIAGLIERGGLGRDAMLSQLREEVSAVIGRV